MLFKTLYGTQEGRRRRGELLHNIRSKEKTSQVPVSVRVEHRLSWEREEKKKRKKEKY